MSPGANQIKELGELDDEMVVIHPVERVGFQEILVEPGFEGEAGEFLDFIRA